MNNQDFEAYADFKKFNQRIPEVFESLFFEMSPEKRADIRILDIGCGDGKFYNFLIDNGFKKDNIYGTEVSQKRIDRCQELGWINTYLNDEFFKLGEKEFDIIIMMEVIEHIPKDRIQALMSQISKVLKPTEGRFYVTTPQYPIKRFYDYYDAIVFKHKHKFKDDPTHVAKYSYAELEKSLSSTFRVERKSGFKDGFLYRKLGWERFKHKMFLALTKY